MGLGAQGGLGFRVQALSVGSCELVGVAWFRDLSLLCWSLANPCRALKILCLSAESKILNPIHNRRNLIELCRYRVPW